MRECGSVGRSRIQSCRLRGPLGIQAVADQRKLAPVSIGQLLPNQKALVADRFIHQPQHTSGGQKHRGQQEKDRPLRSDIAGSRFDAPDSHSYRNVKVLTISSSRCRKASKSAGSTCPENTALEESLLTQVVYRIIEFVLV